MDVQGKKADEHPPLDFEERSEIPCTLIISGKKKYGFDPEVNGSFLIGH